LKAPRCRLRMFEAAEKARKMLSSDTESNINIDYLLNEEDLNRKLGREEFEKMIDPHVRRFAALITETLQKANINVDDIDNVEMIGDCTRTPALLAVTRQLFNKEELNRTLNSLECIARGAALQSAILNPTFQVKSFAMKDYNNLPVNISYGFKDLSKENASASEMKVYPRFFTQGQKFPLT